MLLRLFKCAVLLLAGLLAACASPTIRNDVQSFHQWPAGSVERSYQLKRLPGQEGSLEHATYESLVRQELAAAGFREAANGRFVVTFDYAVQTRVTRVIDPPIMVAPSFWWGPGLYRSGWGLSVGVPFGYPWYPPIARDFTSNVRTVRLFMNDQSSAGAARVWEGTATSAGASNDLVVVLPYMVRALLTDFPGQSGSSRRVDVELPQDR